MAKKAADHDIKPQSVLRSVMRGIGMLCIRRGWNLSHLLEAAKGALVDAAASELKRSGSKINTSRISTMTGVYRADVDRLLKQKSGPADNQVGISQVLQYWASHRDFIDDEGVPELLTYKGKNSDFYRLCQRVSKALNPAAVYFELNRTGRVVQVGDRIKLERAIGQFGQDAEKAFNILARDVETAVVAVDENLAQVEERTNLHISTLYDNIYVKDVPEIRAWIIEMGKKFHRSMRAYLAAYDKDLNPELGDGSQAGVKVRVIAASLIELPTIDEERHVD